MRRLPTLALVAVIGVAGCGTNAAEQARKKQAQRQAESQRHEETERREEAQRKEREEQQKEREKQAVQAEARTCSEQLDPIIKAEAHLKGDLAVGLNISEYNDQLKKVNVAYEEIPFKKMSSNCLKAGVGVEKALNEYNKAQGIWESCLGESECQVSSIHPKLEEHWHTAGTHLEKAKEVLEELSSGTVPSGDA